MSTPDPQESEGRPAPLTLSELATLVGIRQQVLRRLVGLGLVSSQAPWPDLRFDPEVVPRVRRLVRLHYHLEVSWSSMSLVLDLLERIDALERRLQPPG